MTRYTRKRLQLTLLLICYAIVHFTQTIVPNLPIDFSVCETNQFEVSISAGANKLTNLELSIDFTTLDGVDCGIFAEEVEGGDFKLPFDPINPIILIPDITAGTQATIRLTVTAPCQTLDCINNGELFRNCFELNANGQPLTNICSDFYSIETANLVISEVNAAVQGDLKLGDVTNRDFTVTNTRLGRLSEFIFCDRHQGGFCVETNVGTVIEEDSFNYCILLNGDDFQQIGDGDAFFEDGEQIEIEEIITIKSCGIEPSSSVSSISVEWGCNELTCQEDQQTAALYFKATTALPNLSFEPITTIAECFCGPEPFQQGMFITNTGDGPAVDINLLLRHPGASGGFDLESIYADSIGILLDLAPFSGFDPIEPQDYCDIPVDVNNNANIPINQLGAGESLVVYWDDYLCSNGCRDEGIAWFYGYNYNATCGDLFFMIDTIEVEEKGDQIINSLIIDPATPQLTDGLVHNFIYNLDYADLDTEEGTLTIEMNIPCGLTWETNNSPSICGQTATIEIETFSEFEKVTLEYDMPLCEEAIELNFDLAFFCEDLCEDLAICKDSIATSCTGIDTCIINRPPELAIETMTSVNRCQPYPNECAPQTCRDFNFSYDCTPDSICLDMIPGYMSYAFDVNRISLGKCDVDDSGTDCNMGCDTSLWNLKRAIPGDTLRAEMKGRVVVDIPDGSFSYGMLEMFVTAGAATNLNAGIFQPNGIVSISNQIRIYDRSEDVWYECANIPLVETEVAPLRYYYEFSPTVISTAGCDIPMNWVFEDGDSVCFLADYLLDENVLREEDDTPLSVRVNFSPNVLLFNDPNVDLDFVFRCGCSSESILLSGYEYTLFPGTFAVPPCEESAFIGGSLIQFSLADGNFFPYEYRDLARLQSLKISLPDEFEMIESQLTFLRSQTGTDILLEEPLMPDFIDGEICFDLANFVDSDCGIDEGFLALFQYRFRQACNLSGSHDFDITANVDLADLFTNEPDVVSITENTDALRSLIPNLILNAPFCDISSFGSDASFDFSITNFQSQIAGQTSGIAQNFWLIPAPESNNIDSCILVNTTSNEVYIPENGIYQLDSLLPNEVINLQLICQNKSCQQESIQIRYGWSCTPFTDPINIPCNENSKTFTVIAPPGSLEMELTSPEECYALCDTIPYHIVEIFNADLGCVFDQKITAQAPAGVNYLMGSTQIEYPCGSGSFLTTADPTILSNGDFIWDLCALLPNLEDCCLPPVSTAPDNCFRLRFLSETSCDFAANNRYIMRATGAQNCGVPTNSPSDISDPICIENVSPNVMTTLSVENSDIICENNVSHTVVITVTEETQLGECLIVEPPLGIAYVMGSCTTISTPASTCLVTENNQGFNIPLPVGVPAGESIILSFETTGYANLDCGSVDINFQSALETLINCAVDNQECAAKVITGSAFSSIEIDRPIFELSDFNITATNQNGNDAVSFTINVLNTGISTNSPNVLEIYLDNDGDGQGDDLVHLQIEPQIINTNQSIAVSGTFEIPPTQLCNLLAVLSPDCACLSNAIAVNQPIIYETGQDEVLCASESISIGLNELPGYSYQWTAPNDASCLDYLACPTCPVTDFTFLNLTTAAKTCDYVLIAADNNGCIIENQVSVTVQPQPRICFADASICVGETVNICACGGVDFQWSPAAPNEICIAVQPQVNTIYRATITDADGCIGIDSITINVNQPPITSLPTEQVFCPDELPQLQAGGNANYNFNWSPGLPVLDNPTLANPTILIETDNVFSVTITDEQTQCQSIEEVAVSFGQDPDLTISPDITICLGDEVQLTAAGAATYVWANPVSDVDCQNNDCSVVLLTPEETTTFMVSGTSTTGCTIVEAVIVTVVEDIIINTVDENICEGTSFDINGIPQFEAGIYCDTMPQQNGCFSLNCINLIVNPVQEQIITEEICPGDTIEIGGQFYTETSLITLTNQFGCDSIIRLNIDELPTPDIEIEGPTLIAITDTVNLSVPEGFSSYTWTSSNGALPCEDFTCMDIPSMTTTYSVTVTNEEGCTTTQSIEVEVDTSCPINEVQIPNVFTPNGDDSNDLFAPVLTPYPNVTFSQIEVWNRWGDRVYFARTNAAWDGLQNGKAAPADVYYYQVELVCTLSGETKLLTGDVTLIQ